MPQFSLHIKQILSQLVCVVLLLAACQTHEEEIVPVPKDSEQAIADASPAGSDEGAKPDVSVDSAHYQYGEYKGLPFRFLAPPAPQTSMKYPMLVFLHGMGERGKDNEKQLNIGASYFLSDSTRTKYPALIVYPQCPSNAYWFDGEIMEVVKELADSLQLVFPIDDGRISVGGFSMGAYGTFELASRYPGYFEAALAMAGDGDESKAGLMAQSRWRIFAGGHDDVVSSAKSQQIAGALKRAGASVEFTLYPQANHHRTWVYAFSEPDFFDWLFGSQTPILASPYSPGDLTKVDRSGS